MKKNSIHANRPVNSPFNPACPCELQLKIMNAPVEIEASGKSLGSGYLTLTGTLCPACKSAGSKFNARVHGDFAYNYVGEQLKGITSQSNYIDAYGQGHVADRAADYNLLLVENSNGDIMISLTIRTEIIDFNFSGVTRKQNVIRRNCTS
ncbi:hypothetical protein [Pseudalkalibacillus salsuginis]|uniref:hypothetical protein n=1 Tax=Pseudalkalibacillus salsuginis TaxID=2910972 RepID=UPI001F17A7F8|nr:hypothetical protein [Pseudalkalibacillus salsuginis]MCF6409779.1 hypothetical protein [Pseudalkalibacillus salsuginis]